MGTLLKMLTLPVWLPVKILWFIAKLFAFLVLVTFVAVLIIYLI